MRYHTMIVYGDEITHKMNAMDADYIFHFIAPFVIDSSGIVQQYRLIYSAK